MEKLTQGQVDAVYEWLMSYSQLKKGAIPARFKEEFLNKDCCKFKKLPERGDHITCLYTDDFPSLRIGGSYMVLKLVKDSVRIIDDFGYPLTIPTDQFNY